ncbi:MAG: hypothetical protein Q9192_006937 [Flavoplaca navasiana]
MPLPKILLLQELSRSCPNTTREPEEVAIIGTPRVIIPKATQSLAVSRMREVNDGWGMLWDSMNPEHMKTDFFDGRHYGYPLEAFRHPTCPSSFAWMLRIFAVCPTSADERNIELPASLKDKAAMLEEAQKYKKHLDGRHPLLQGYCLEDDQWQSDDPDGWDCYEKTCKRCRQGQKINEKASKVGDRRQEAGKRSINYRDLLSGIIAPGVEFWENPLFHWVEPDLWTYWSWENTSMGIMTKMVNKLGDERVRKL